MARDLVLAYYISCSSRVDALDMTLIILYSNIEDIMYLMNPERGKGNGSEL